MAQLGSRLVDGVAKNMADKFFTSFAAVAASAAAPAGAAEPAAQPTAAAEPKAAQRSTASPAPLAPAGKTSWFRRIWEWFMSLWR